MRKFLSLMIALCLLPLAYACASPALDNMLVYNNEDVIPGVTLDALQVKDGMLLVGASDYMDSGWLAFFDEKGKKRWSYSADTTDLFRCPSPLPGGGFSILRKRSVEETEDMGAYQTSDLVIFDRKGKIVEETGLMRSTEWLLTHEGGYYAAANYPVSAPSEEDGMETMRPLLARLDGEGLSTWELEYTHPDYSSMTFLKAAMAGESIIIMGDAYNIKNQAGVGLIHRIAKNGDGIWLKEFALGTNSFINDFCVTSDGLIAGIYTDIAYGEEDTADRLCSVFLMNMDGQVLWQYAVKKGSMLDYILPVQGGFLLGSRGLDLENCPFIGDGWLLLLDKEGKVKAADSTPDIGGGKYEILKIAKNMDGEALLCGNVLDEPGFPGAPFVARLRFEEAYR